MNGLNYGTGYSNTKSLQYCTENLEITISRRTYASEVYGILCSYGSDPQKLESFLQEIQDLAKNQDDCLEVLLFMMFEPIRDTKFVGKDFKAMDCQSENHRRLWQLDGALLADLASLHPVVADHYLTFLVNRINLKIGEEISGLKPPEEGFLCPKFAQSESLKDLARRIELLCRRSKKLHNLCHSVLKDHTKMFEHLSSVLRSMEYFGSSTDVCQIKDFSA
eukprot:CAMPEP_0117740920 /NCGR_PEP_ID=MMETSP0947-20121206/4616_1 /TAXON_ID=44440 /ORGANISM="Chattonella subsalsa, Strain CCMP2191" /LENGTH=220 /DNA_ID=CAMNT_0005557101 /DNA_START=535 /DNA_END=1194 /DNA_ORIENTATION=+